MTPQLATLTVIAGRVALSAGSPRATERLAVEALVIVQFAWAGLMFPVLLGGFAGWAAAVLTALPLLQLSGFLAGAPPGDLAAAGGCLALWLAALTMLRAWVPGNRSGSAVAGATLLTLGGLLLWYLESEFAGPVSIAHYLPLPSLLLFLRHQGNFALPLSSTALLAAICFVLLLAARNRRRRLRD